MTMTQINGKIAVLGRDSDLMHRLNNRAGMASCRERGLSMEKNTIIELRNISKKFDDEVVLDNICLNIRDREFITFLGPSGCGKTTMLRIIAGFLEADSGQVIFEGKDINSLPPHKRQVNTIFQRYQLFPHLNVYENIAFGLRNKHLKEKEISKKYRCNLFLIEYLLLISSLLFNWFAIFISP